MTSKIDLDAYFNRIGYAGSRTPDLASLRGIVAAHTRTIPFENLDPLLRRPLGLTLGSLERKLVHGGRGGYCFEHNLLLKHVLEALGFLVEGSAARVRWNVPADTATARGHMLLLVEVENTAYVVDVGFGGLTLTAPLRLEVGPEQPTPHERFRLIRAGESYIMQAHVRGEWNALYQFDLQQQLLPDYEVTSWYLSNHPKSHFINGLMAARADRGRRYVLRNAELAVHSADGSTERHTLRTAGRLRRTLEETLRITLPDAPELMPTLERIVAAGHEQDPPTGPRERTAGVGIRIDPVHSYLTSP